MSSAILLDFNPFITIANIVTINKKKNDRSASTECDRIFQRAEGVTDRILHDLYEAR